MKRDEGAGKGESGQGRERNSNADVNWQGKEMSRKGEGEGSRCKHRRDVACAYDTARASIAGRVRFYGAREEEDHQWCRVRLAASSGRGMGEGKNRRRPRKKRHDEKQDGRGGCAGEERRKEGTEWAGAGAPATNDTITDR